MSSCATRIVSSSSWYRVGLSSYPRQGLAGRNARLGERLKRRTIEQVVPALADGFLTHFRIRRGCALDLSEEEMHRASRATLTLVLRLLFLLQAEARRVELADGTDRQWEQTLLRLKTEVAHAAGPLEEKVPSRIANVYSSDPTATRLSRDLLGPVRMVRSLLGPGLSGPDAAAERFLE